MTEIINIGKDTNTWVSIEEAEDMAQKIHNKICNSFHALCFISHYMVYIHNLWSFIREVEVAVIPNDRIKESEKISYVIDHIQAMEADNKGIQYVIEYPNMITENNFRIEFMETKKELSQKDPLKYFNLLPRDESVVIPLLGRLLYCHSYIIPLFDSIIEDTEFDKLSVKNKWKKLQKVFKCIIDLNLFK